MTLIILWKIETGFSLFFFNFFDFCPKLDHVVVNEQKVRSKHNLGKQHIKK